MVSVLFSIGNSLSAQPPKKVISSCHRERAIDSTVQFKELYVLYDIKPEDVKSTCLNDPHRDLIGVKTEKRFFYQENCNGTEYFLAGNRRFSLEESIVHSLSPEIKAYGANYHSEWYLITFENVKYICMASVLGDNGWAAATTQYYLIENAFNDDLPLKSYFYFFDKKFIDIVRARGWGNG
ncbi:MULTISPECIES: hypothetical protein [Legionella]|uniref:Uncharacterized protein n=1 Tax=Legionella shakespearei DSM 23087 TaxID=1122169 RepID=A0A0W0YKU2_9GAMM|nr:MULTISPECIES: hypothetical protein [Legionella]KTD57316.1 hypothetical protein Lsha_2698 [Legionella shakespearei DSM 23087]MCW8451730.1 hypothetical protein [Legionella quinlivanii]